MGESRQIYVLAAIGAFLFFALAGGAGMWIYAEQRIAGDSQGEARRQALLADAARREAAAQAQTLNEMKTQLDNQRDAGNALAAELRNELATQRTLLENLKNQMAARPARNVVDEGRLTRPRVVRPQPPLADGADLGGAVARQALKGRAWGPEQATGEPDTPTAGDQQTAWASLTQDGQPEWLILDYAQAVNITRVKVYETYNPGALVRVTVFDEKTGKEIEVWQGKDPTPMGAGMGVSEIALAEPRHSKRVKIYLDSVNVPGWNEIDAVGIVDDAGKTQWAVNATASSTFAEQDWQAVPKPRPALEGRQEF